MGKLTMTARGPHWLHSRDVRYNLLIAVLAALALLPALIQPSHLIYPSWSEFSDLTLIHWPKVTLIRQSLAQGTGWPLWAPYGLSGQPLAANQLAMLFYPPALLLLIGPQAWSFSVFYALHLAWAGLGAYWLARGLGRRPESALLAGAIVALSGKLAAHTAIGHASLVAAIAWAPWALAFLHHALTHNEEGSSLKFALLTGAALAAQAATHTYALVYTAYGLIVYAAVCLLLAPSTEGGQERLRRVSRLAAIPLTAILLGAAQLLPLLEMAGASNRSFSFAEATLFSLSPAQTLAGLLFPTQTAGHEWTIYPGLLTLGLAGAAWLGMAAAGRSMPVMAAIRREWPVVALTLLSLIGVILAFGSTTPLYRLAYEALPGLRWMRTPARLWFFVSLGLAILAAHGLEAWQELWQHPRQRRAMQLLLIVAMGVALALSLAAMAIWHQTGRGVWGLTIFGVLSGALLWWAARHRPATPAGQTHRITPTLAGLALLLIVADLLSFDLTLLRFPSLDEVSAQGREASEWLSAQPAPARSARSYSPTYSVPQPAAIQAGLEQIDGVEPVHLAAYDQFMAAAGGYGQSAFSVTIPPFPDGLPQGADDLPTPDLRLLGLLNGRYLASAFPLPAEMPDLALRWQGAGTWIYENALALPRAFVVHQAEAIAGSATMDEALNCMEAIDVGRVALVSDGRPLDGLEGATPARITNYSPNRLTIETDLERPGLLVLSEIWYPGWQARDNDQPVSIVRTDALLRGVYLDQGSHTVEFVYRPWTVQAGLLTSGATTLVLLVYAVARRRGLGKRP